MIYDESKKKWYVVRRGFRGKLVLREVGFENCIRFKTDKDLTFSDSSGLKQVVMPPEPPTPQ